MENTGVPTRINKLNGIKIKFEMHTSTLVRMFPHNVVKK